jgi:hypothetical protein
VRASTPPPTSSRLTLTLTGPQLGAFRGLFQLGVAVPTETGGSVLRFLTDELGIDPAYVAGRITTVFLDGQVVDGLETAVLRPGSRLALSAALPGLVGATFRRSGIYAAMRASITRAAERPDADASHTAEQLVHVKLFNLLIDEVGPILLRHGIVLSRDEALAALPGVGGVRELPRGPTVLLRAVVGEERS